MFKLCAMFVVLSAKKEMMRKLYIQIAFALAIVSALLAVIVASMLIVTHLQVTVADPLENPAIKKLRLQLDANPRNDVLREGIREIDLLARKSFFTSQYQIRVGGHILIGSLVVLLLCLNIISFLQKKLPDPRGCPGKDNPYTNTLLARKVTLIATVFLLSLVFFIVFFTDTDISDELLTDTERSQRCCPPTVSIRSEQEPEQTKITDSSLQIPSSKELDQNWICFRGRRGGNILQTHDSLPTEWNGENQSNIFWKVNVPMSGFSSPVVWKNHIYLSGGSKKSIGIMAFDTETGTLKWNSILRTAEPADAFPEVSDDTGYAAATMVTDGIRVYAVFATGDLYAYTLTGKQVWHRNFGVPDNMYGHSSSLMLYKNRIIVQYDHNEDARLIALNSLTGETEWDIRREDDISWASPIVVEENEVAHIIIVTSAKVSCHSAESGKLNWEVSCMSGEIAVSPAYADGLVFAANEYACIAAIDIRTGDVVWQTDEVELPDVASPVATKDHVFLATSTAMIICLDSKTGKLLWETETDAGYYSSPILINGMIYIFDKNGHSQIFMPEKEYKQVSVSDLGEGVVSTPAFVGNRIYVRGIKNLYCIGASDE